MYSPKTKTGSYIVSTILLLLVTACDSGTGALTASPPEVVPEAFTIRSREVAVSENRLEGTFLAFGMIEDGGTVRQVLDAPTSFHRPGSISGVKTLEGAKGTIVIEFYAALSRIDAFTLRAVGSFYIIKGTGAYADLAGGGEIDLAVAANASPVALTRVLEGVAHHYAR